MARLCLLANAASSHTEKWASELAHRGWDVDIISFLPADIPRVKVHIVPPVSGKKADVIFRQHWIAQRVRSLEPDLVHAHYASSFGLLGALAGVHPLLVSAWGSDVFAFPRKSILHRHLLEWTLKQADVLCSTSHIMAKEMRKYVSADQPIEVIPFGVDVRRFAPPEPESQKAHTGGAPTTESHMGEPVVFGVAKHLQPVYGIDVLLRAFSELESRRPGQALLRIAGDGPEWRRLTSLAKRLGVNDQVDWLGLIRNQDVAGFYQGLDVVVVPSHQESFGVTALEASACGRPIIASHVGGLPEVVIHGETGILVPPGDASAFSQAMESLLLSSAERERLGHAGRNFVLEHYDWMENVSKMEEVYRRLV